MKQTISPLCFFLDKTFFFNTAVALKTTVISFSYQEILFLYLYWGEKGVGEEFVQWLLTMSISFSLLQFSGVLCICNIQLRENRCHYK